MTDPGWQAGQPNGSSTWSNNADGRQTNSKTSFAGKPDEQRHLDKARARHLRNKLHDAARHRALSGKTEWSDAAAAPAETMKTRPHTPEPYAPRPVSNPEEKKPTRPTFGNMALVAGIPIAMAGLFFAGYFGGRIAAVYWNDTTSETQVASSSAAPASESGLVSTAEVVTVSPDAPKPVVEPSAAEAKPSITPSPAEPAVTEATAPAQSLPKPVAPPSLTTQPEAPKPTVVANVPAADDPPAAAIAPPSAGDPASAKAASLIGQGHKLLAKGDVSEARKFFTRAMRLGLPEAALALGRSYDPRYLAQLPKSDAAPDAEMAGKMYRDWYIKSVEAGSVSGDVQLDKLLQAMNAQ